MPTPIKIEPPWVRVDLNRDPGLHMLQAPSQRRFVYPNHLSEEWTRLKVVRNEPRLRGLKTKRLI